MRALAIVALVACGDNHRETPDAPGSVDVLIYTRTNGFRHDAIETADAVLPHLLAVRGISSEVTEDPAAFEGGNLDRFHAVAFLYTTGNDILAPDGKTAFEAFVRNGGGFFGLHSATDTEYEWPFYQDLVVAHFADHPAIQVARVAIENRDNPGTATLPAGPWIAADEWYNFASDPRGDGVTVLATVDESTYSGGTMGADHPIAWAHERLGGRMFYSALGHVPTRWQEGVFLAHVTGGIQWVLGR